MDQRITIVIGLFIIFLLFININNLIHFENFESKTVINKDNNLIDTYIDYNKKIYEYIFNKNILTRQKKLDIQKKFDIEKKLDTESISDIYNKINSRLNEFFVINKCGFTYNYYENESIVPGSIYLTETEIVFSNQDLNNNNGLSEIIESSNTIVISDGIITYQLPKNEYNIDPVTGIITLVIDSKIFNDDFFKVNVKYILYPCYTLEHIDSNITLSPSTVQQKIIDNGIQSIMWAYIGILIGIFIIYNWRYFWTLLTRIKKFFTKEPIEPVDTHKSSDIEPSNIYYIGGYDYKDYSE